MPEYYLTTLHFLTSDNYLKIGVASYKLKSETRWQILWAYEAAHSCALVSVRLWNFKDGGS